MMLANITPKCKGCGKRYPIIAGDDLPAMLGFVTRDGRRINVCKHCIMKMGRSTEEEKKEFFDKLGIDYKKGDQE